MRESLYRLAVAFMVVASFAACSASDSQDPAKPSPSPNLNSQKYQFVTAAEMKHIMSSAPSNPTPKATPKPHKAGAAVESQSGDSHLDVASLNGSIRHLMNEYSGLKSRVEGIIDRIDGGENSDEVVGDSGQQWYSDERDFQSEISGLPTTLAKNPQYLDIKGNLAEAETFLYSAGADAMASCNAANARRELGVADYFFGAVRKEMNTGIVTSDDASNPPLVDSADDKCPQS